MRSRPIEENDVERILAIQAACPEIAQWTNWDYNRVARGEMAGWVVEEDGSVAGFIVARKIADEIEILNFAVATEMRERGIGKHSVARSSCVVQELSQPRTRYWKFVLQTLRRYAFTNTAIFIRWAGVRVTTIPRSKTRCC